MHLTIAYSKIKKWNLVLINNATQYDTKEKTLSERPIWQPLMREIDSPITLRTDSVVLVKSETPKSLHLGTACPYFHSPHYRTASQMHFSPGNSNNFFGRYVPPRFSKVGSPELTFWLKNFCSHLYLRNWNLAKTDKNWTSWRCTILQNVEVGLWSLSTA